VFGLLSSFVSCIKDMSVVLIILVRRNSLLEKVWLLWRRPLTLIDAILSAELVVVVCRRDVAMLFGSGRRCKRRCSFVVRLGELGGDCGPSCASLDGWELSSDSLCLESEGCV
jgi:hypothetical protein